MFYSIKTFQLSNFRKVRTARSWQVWTLVCFLLVQSLFAVMDHHLVLESPNQHFARHLLDLGQHAQHQHVESRSLSDINSGFDNTYSALEDEYACDKHFHGINLVALPFSALTLEIVPPSHEQSDIVTRVLSAFPPPRYRPPIV